MFYWWLLGVAVLFLAYNELFYLLETGLRSPVVSPPGTGKKMLPPEELELEDEELEELEELDELEELEELLEEEELELWASLL